MRYKCIMSHLTLTEASQGERQARQPPLNWQKSSAQKVVSQLTEKEERIVTATIHFLRTESDICSLLHLAVPTVKYVTKSLPWGGTSVFSRSRDWPLLVSVNCDVPEAYNFEFGVMCFWMYSRLKNCSVNCDWNTLRETWTAKILYTVHISHWRWILKILNH